MDAIEKYGDPLEVIIIEHETDNIGGSYRIKVVYPDFYMNCWGYSRDISGYNIGSIVITSDRLAFTRDRIKVGDSKSKILHCYRYYGKISESEYGYGYVDGSMRTIQTFIEFTYDENDCVETIELYIPW